MEGWQRRIRGAIGMGLTWALAWFGAGMAIMVVLLLTTGETQADVPYPLGFGAIGFVAGVTFSGVLGLVEGRRTFAQMSLPRFAEWGAVGGFLFSVIFVLAVALGGDTSLIRNLPFLGPFFAGVGAVCATGVLAVARRAKDGDHLSPGPDADPVGSGDGKRPGLPDGGR